MKNNEHREVNRDIIKEAREFLELAQVGHSAAEKCQRDPICLFQEMEEGYENYKTTKAFLSVREASAYRKEFSEEHPSTSTQLYVVTLHADRHAQGSRYREIINGLLDLCDGPIDEMPMDFIDDEGRPIEPPPVSPSSGDILC